MDTSLCHRHLPVSRTPSCAMDTSPCHGHLPVPCARVISFSSELASKWADGRCLALKPSHPPGPRCACLGSVSLSRPDTGTPPPGAFSILVLFLASQPVLATPPWSFSALPEPGCQVITAASGEPHWTVLYQGPALAGLCVMARLFTACLT